MKTIPVRKAIDLCAGIGYKAVELALMPGWDTEPKLLSAQDRAEIRKQIDGAGLTLPSVMENLQAAG